MLSNHQQSLADRLLPRRQGCPASANQVRPKLKAVFKHHFRTCYAEVVPAAYIIKAASTIVVRRKVENEALRTVDILLWLNQCFRTAYSKQNSI